MATSNCVADVRKFAAKAIKAGDTTVQAPSKWATAAGYPGSDASPLRKHMARDNGNGCGRQNRYPKVSAEGLLELLDMADAYQAESEQRKRDALHKRIGSKLRPATRKGAVQAKTTARRTKGKAKDTAELEEALEA